MLDSAHISIVATLANQRIAHLDTVNTAHLDQAIQDAVAHEYMNLIELRDALACHFEQSFATAEGDKRAA